MKASNQSIIKKNNQRAILNYIIENGAISRADLAKKLGITKPTVSTNITKLIDMTVLNEIGFCKSDMGKKPMLVDFNKNYKYVLVLDFISFRTRNIVMVSVCNLANEIIFVEQLNLGANYSSPIINEVMPSRLLQLLTAYNVDLDKLAAIVITAATAVYNEGLLIFECPNGDLVNLAKVITDNFHQPIIIKNDINLAALGEKHFGVGKGVNNLIFLWAGVAVGGGLILNGKLFEGHDGIGGELACSTVYNECTGEYELLKNIFSLDGIKVYIEAHKEQAKTSIISELLFSNKLHLEDMIVAAHSNDEFCIDFAQFIAYKIAAVISTVSNLLNLEMAIIGGEYSQFGDIIIDTLTDRVALMPITKLQVTTPMYNNSAMYGAFQVGTEFIINNII